MDPRYARRLPRPAPPRPRLSIGQVYSRGNNSFAIVSHTAGHGIQHERQRFSYGGPVDVLNHATGVYYGFPLSVYERNPQHAPSQAPARPAHQPPVQPGIHFQQANPQED